MKARWVQIGFQSCPLSGFVMIVKSIGYVRDPAPIGIVTPCRFTARSKLRSIERRDPSEAFEREPKPAACGALCPSRASARALKRVYICHERKSKWRHGSAHRGRPQGRQLFLCSARDARHHASRRHKNAETGRRPAQAVGVRDWRFAPDGRSLTEVCREFTLRDQARFDLELHRERCCVPAARCEPLKNRVFRR